MVHTSLFRLDAASSSRTCPRYVLAWFIDPSFSASRVLQFFFFCFQPESGFSMEGNTSWLSEFCKETPRDIIVLKKINMKSYFIWNVKKGTFYWRQLFGKIDRFIYTRGFYLSLQMHVCFTTGKFPTRFPCTRFKRLILHLLSFLFTIYVCTSLSPLSPSLTRDTRSFMVARQDTAAMVTLYGCQGRAPASRSGCQSYARCRRIVSRGHQIHVNAYLASINIRT